MAIKVSDAMTRRIVFSDPASSAQDVANLMSSSGISSVIVSRGGVIAGIVTEKDIVIKVVSRLRDPKDVKAEELMSKPVATIDSEADLEDAARIMRDRRIKKLIAVKDGKAEGIITSYDIMAAEPVLRLLLEKGL